MGKILISYEQFEKHIFDIMNLLNLRDEIIKIEVDYNKKSLPLSINYPTLIENVIDLLALLTNDEFKWIDYWVFELECGKRYKAGMISDKNNANIKLKTIEDLWAVLLNN